MKLEPGEFETICACVGQIIVPFSAFEASLNVTIETIYKHLGGNALDRELPVSFTRRVKYLHKCLNQLPVLSAVKDELQAILSVATAESTVRNCVAHAYVSNFERNTGTFTFTQLEAKTNKQSHTEQSTSYSLTELLDSGQRILDCSTAMNNLAHRIVDLGMPHDQADNS